jgi:hypothetical protein
MVHIETNDTENELIRFVQDWFDLISDGNIKEACKEIDKPNCYGIIWTPGKIEEIIKDEFGPETVFGQAHPNGVCFSTIHDTQGTFRADVLKFDDGSGYSVEHDVPLNGEWSDLTAQFEFIGDKAEFEVILHDLHVL